MPQRTRATVDKLALSFFNANLRDDPSLRHSCRDRHALDTVIVRWKEGLQIVGVPPSAIVNSLRKRWKLIDTIVTEEDVVVWAADVADGHDKDRRIARVVKDTTRDRIALSFYNAMLRDDPDLRRSCSDRHVLDEVIDRWKVGQRLDGSQVRVPRSDIVFSFRVRLERDAQVSE